MEVIKLQNVSKTYTHYTHGLDRLLEIITHQTRHQKFTALHPLDLTISTGQVVGIIGKNGAGKSTLLKMIAGTLLPSSGHCEVKGRVAALLELGSGFHPEMTGRENVYLKGAMMGLSASKMEAIYHDIVAFADIEAFMEQPVKTYSSGMFMRLAFAVATCIEPDILIVDEALSVGDGAFARKSFDRIMQFKQAHKTILFCSHSLYQVEAICDRVLWLEKGHLQLEGAPSAVVSAYNQFLLAVDTPQSPVDILETANDSSAKAQVLDGTAHLTEITLSVDGIIGTHLDALSLQSELCLTIGFSSDPKLPTPTLGVVLQSTDGRIVTSASSKQDGLMITTHAQGTAKVRIQFPRLPLLKGEYSVIVYLLCENAIHLYDSITLLEKINVRQPGLELGVVTIPHQWAQI